MSKILNLKDYDLVFTTSFENTHGVSGHLYEMIDYYYICKQSGMKCVILLSDGTTKELFESALKDKYNFNTNEIDDFLVNTIQVLQPKIIITNRLCIVDGDSRLNNSTIYANHVILLRCQRGDFDYFHNHKTIKQIHLLQDFNLYTQRYENLNIKVIDYTKKILWSKYKKPSNSSVTNTALLYLTTNCRAVSDEYIKNIVNKKHCDNYLIITNDVDRYSGLKLPNVTVEKTPVKNIFDKFDTYVYTSIPNKFDCSPRFIVECAVFDKKVIYEIDYVDPGIECRKRDINENLAGLELTKNDYFIEYVKQCMIS